ncbi:MAG: sialate O-acetylesterase [Planctomycetota bacterium]
MRIHRCCALGLVLGLLAGVARAQPEEAASSGPLKVFILAGQSNMQGHGHVVADPERNGGQGTLEYLVRADETKERFGHLIDDDGNWVSRDDVSIWYLDRSGPLTVGYGAREGLIGPELGFGHVVGEHFEEPVLLIKIAWGGKSLAVDFRPPSAGGEVGPFYRQLIDHVKKVLEERDTLFPKYRGRRSELAGFGWHQGWNDRVNQAHNDAYEENLVHFIQDVRKELGVPKLPFVIAETGMSGHEEKHPRALSLMRAQAAVAERKELRGKVAFVPTRDFFRPKEQSPSGQAYHWNTNAETYTLIGESMGRAMISLVESDSSDH